MVAERPGPTPAGPHRAGAGGGRQDGAGHGARQTRPRSEPSGSGSPDRSDDLVSTTLLVGGSAAGATQRYPEQRSRRTRPAGGSPAAARRGGGRPPPARGGRWPTAPRRVRPMGSMARPYSRHERQVADRAVVGRQRHRAPRPDAAAPAGGPRAMGTMAAWTLLVGHRSSVTPRAVSSAMSAGSSAAGRPMGDSRRPQVQRAPDLCRATPFAGMTGDAQTRVAGDRVGRPEAQRIGRIRLPSGAVEAGQAVGHEVDRDPGHGGLGRRHRRCAARRR